MTNPISLLHFEGADGSTVFRDQRGLVWTPVGNAQIDTARKKFGDASMTANSFSTLSGISTPIAPFQIGTALFTLDFWFYRVNTLSLSLTRFMSGIEISSSFSPDTVTATIYDGTTTYYLTTSSVISNGAWYHVALIRVSSTQFEFYLNGIKEVTQVVSSGYSLSMPGPSAIIFGTSTGTAEGNIDEFRFGLGARWTANFTPPTVPYRYPKPSILILGEY